MLQSPKRPSAPRPAACAAAGHHIVSCSYPGATSVPEWRTGPIYPVAHPSPVTYRLDTRLVTFFTEGCYPPAVSKAAAKVASGPDLLASPVSIAAGSIVSLTGKGGSSQETLKDAGSTRKEKSYDQFLQNMRMHQGLQSGRGRPIAQ
ncbi:hypothetical protein PENNAL_c0072G05938 [Penicillium nalgiovense]|uniref:Uncharacterized protein n=1 Tax=Penicillium nalgiovense TaxID=60175 RepID=A0A1V6XKC1_PENNA|nr:hypothetical protein PENNAL_c0072G05938 [Penicillium nalgiovense]